MVNAWSLAFEELYGNMDKEYPIMSESEKQKVPGLDVSDIGYGGLVRESVDDVYAHHFPATGTKYIPKKPSIEKAQIRKYEEDKGIKDLQDYISTTYGGHYTSNHNNVQTLDLIESVGDAEAFCRSNAIKYLSRYDKKGQARRDILKALHYTLLLYYFSGHTEIDETPTRGYETF